MTKLSLAIFDKAGVLKSAKRGEEGTMVPLAVRDKDFVYLAMRDFKYEDGDQIRLESDTTDCYLMVKLDETMDSTLVYLRKASWTYTISLDQNRVAARPAQRFSGESHYLSVRVATKKEIQACCNLALNPHDQKDFTGIYPHAYANVETRNDAAFFACNAIDGIYANHSHGSYPFQSWGINQQKDAALSIDFGRLVELDTVVFTWRADFPHDSYWKKVSILFSDGTRESFDTKKTARPQSFTFSQRQVTGIVFTNLIQGEDTSPFPALTQIECYGRNVDFQGVDGDD